MSLILDALNKADREREYRDAVPDINTVHGSIQPRRDHRLRLLAGGLALALAVILGLLLIVWLRAPSAPADTRTLEPAEPPITPPQVAALTPPPSPQSQPAALAGGFTETPRTPLLEVDQEVQALYQPQEDSQVLQVIEPRVKTESTQAAAPPQERRSSVDEALARALWEESKRELEQVPAVPITIKPESKPTAVTNQIPADTPPEETLAGHTDVPFLHELPVSTQNTIPTLMYAKHEYDRGFVVINKEELQVGSATAGGVLLERILADGVLLSLDGTSFKLASLSSWVNY